jgi:uncharacterized C2H2 Zn-finger protein
VVVVPSNSTYVTIQSTGSHVTVVKLSLDCMRSIRCVTTLEAVSVGDYDVQHVRDSPVHRRQRDGPLEYICKPCDKHFTNAEALLQHVNKSVQHRVPEFQCSTCLKTFSSTLLLQKVIAFLSVSQDIFYSLACSSASIIWSSCRPRIPMPTLCKGIQAAVSDRAPHRVWHMPPFHAHNPPPGHCRHS